MRRGARGTAMAALLAGAAALGACGEKGVVVRDPAKWGGWYESDTLAASIGPKVVRLQIRYDTTADVSIEFVGVGTTHHPGWWLARGNELTMQPTRGDGPPNELPFRWRFENGRLTPLEWDHAVYGEKPVTLTRLVPPAWPADSTAGARR